MNSRRTALASAGVGALLGCSLAMTALASNGQPSRMHMGSQAGRTTINGSLYVNDVMRVQKNSSVYGKFYAHNGAQVWNHLLVHSGGISVEKDGVNVQSGGLTVGGGGIRADSMVVSGPISVHDATVTGNLQAGTLQSTGTINGQSLAVVSSATVGGALSVGGKISGSGLDTGNGAVASGSLTTGGLAASSIADGGSLTAGDVRAVAANLTNLTVTGNVNFANASVTGLNLGNLSLGNLSLQTATVGNPANSTPPLNLSANGRTAQIGVSSNGNLTVDTLIAGTGLGTGGNLTVSGNSQLAGSLSVGGNTALQGNLTVNSPGGISASIVQAPLTGTGAGASSGPLTLSGNTISLQGNVQSNGNITLSNGSNLTFSAGGTSAASHVLANGDSDIAGTTSVSVPSGPVPVAGYSSAPVTFQTPYATPPIVVVTASTDPSPGTAQAPKIWIELIQNASGTIYTGFKVHYVPPVSSVSTDYAVAYNYHMIGS